MKLSSTPALLLAAFVSLTSALSHAAPTINTHPSSAAPALGAAITLSANVTAESGASYEWARGGNTIMNGGRYSGATTDTLVIANANTADNGSYVLTVKDGSGTTPTNPASITVTQTAPGRMVALASFTSIPRCICQMAGPSSAHAASSTRAPSATSPSSPRQSKAPSRQVPASMGK